jgi:hypothetical protein
MAICIGTACVLVAAFGVFSTPLGPANLPPRMPVFAAGAYIPLSLYATLQLWTRPQYTTLFLVTALVPLFVPFIFYLLVFLSR